MRMNEQFVYHYMSVSIWKCCICKYAKVNVYIYSILYLQHLFFFGFFSRFFIIFLLFIVIVTAAVVVIVIAVAYYFYCCLFIILYFILFFINLWPVYMKIRLNTFHDVSFDLVIFFLFFVFFYFISSLIFLIFCFFFGVTLIFNYTTCVITSRRFFYLITGNWETVFNVV